MFILTPSAKHFFFFGKTFHRIISQISICRSRSPTSKFYSRSAALAPFRHQILISMQFV